MFVGVHVSVNNQHLLFGDTTKVTLSAHSLWKFFSAFPMEVTESEKP